MNEIREGIERQMNDLMEAMSEVECTSDEYKKLSERLNELSKSRNEALKIECDYEHNAEAIDTEASVKQLQLDEEKRQFKIKTIVDIGKIALSSAVLLLVGIFETKGTFTSMSFKESFKDMTGGLRFGIRK